MLNPGLVPGFFVVFSDNVRLIAKFARSTKE